MNSELKELLQSVIREELKPVHRRLDQMEIDQHGIKRALDQMEIDQQEIKRAVLDTSERVAEMKSFLENQHRIIELLSARSIQQEAELKRIK
ncbi:hypothetical protein OIN60_21940 [Paenibacillus sp. P96]|uniref:Uncharacterized protein n=1 Tax=Paenibacillus zeirhizosphaerae TaxID=2987519 RepID=A0ABT9FXC4_9BACL|nr:hypothetical protein [Paenibacillus sp. P96]MDP4099382.1 hypothetical protein [Paenibacillus sp. P96]